MVLMLLFIAMFAIYLRLELPQVFRDNTMLAMFTLLTGVVMGASDILVGLLGLSEFTIPLALAPLVVASLMEKRPALVFTLMLAAATAAIMELKAPFVPVAVVGGVTAVYSVARLRHRWHFLRANLIIAVAILAAIAAWDLARAIPPETMLRDGMWGRSTASRRSRWRSCCCRRSSTAWASPRTSRCSSCRISIARCCDGCSSKPRHLPSQHGGGQSRRARRGVDQGQLAAGARVGLLPRHRQADQGRVLRRERAGRGAQPPRAAHAQHECPGGSLAHHRGPRAGAEGAPAARGAERDPRAPRHHGDGIFYDKALQLDPSVRREDYCYPGPRPHSKETAILMLADGVEGASRALQEPTPSRIRGLVTRIVDQRVQDGQLDECGLTLAEVARIREAFIPVLTAISPCTRALSRRSQAARQGRCRLSARTARKPPDVSAPLAALVRAALAGEGRRPGRLGIVLTGDAPVRELNRRWRGLTARPTCSRSATTASPVRS